MSTEKTLDARGLKCPMPIVRARKELDALTPGDVLRVVATDPGSVLDFQGWMKTAPRYQLVSQQEGKDETGRATYTHVIRKNA